MNKSKHYPKLQVGDKIKCHSKDDMIQVSLWLACEGIQTEFDYNKDENRWGLEVKEVEKA